MDRNDERFVAQPGEYVPVNELPPPRLVSEMLIAGGYERSSVEEFTPYLRGLWEWGLATGQVWQTRTGIIRGLNTLGIIDDQEYSDYLLTKTALQDSPN